MDPESSSCNDLLRKEKTLYGLITETIKFIANIMLGMKLEYIG